jgi:hypothetical protein
VVLLLMPEGSAFQALYTPAARPGIEAFLADLSRSRHLPLIDARHWIDDDGFWDSHHLLPDAADLFTDRWARESARILDRVPRR